MLNPWSDLPAEAPYILPSDADAIRRFNERASDLHRVRAEIIPEPYLGNPSAAVVLLNLNPGFVTDGPIVHTDPQFNEAARLNLLHGRPQAPFYLLDQTLKDSPGQSWWMKKLRVLIQRTSLETVAGNVFVAEIHGYHSMRYSPRLQLPSQAYTVELVRGAVARGAEIVVMRGWRHWVSVLPELERLSEVQRVRNVQNPAISPRNVDRFDRIVEATRIA